MSVVEWIGRKLVVRDRDGTFQSPAADPGIRIQEPDGGEMTIGMDLTPLS